MIQLHGIFLDLSPFSSLYEPIDHLRLLAGIAILDNLLRFIFQYYIAISLLALSVYAVFLLSARWF